MSINNQNAGSQIANKVLADKNIRLEDIRSKLTGRLVTADDELYDKARSIFYAGNDRYPALIIQAANVFDIVYAVGLARETGLELAIRSGGHSTAGHSTSDGGIVLDLSPMKAIDIDTEARTAWAEAGMTAGEYTTAVSKHGLATGFGDTGSVGIGGITLGGGIGYFARKYGMTIDDLLAAEIVLADGQVLQVDAKNHPELFWAIRGGGGNFGVVSRFKFRLHEVEKVISGMLMLPASPDILLKLIAEADAAPEELSMIINVMTAMPMPFIPSEYHGKLITFILPLYTGDLVEGEKVMQRIKDVATPIVDFVKVMPYAEIYPPEQDFHPMAASRTMFIDKLDEQDAKTAFEELRKSDAMMAAVQVRVLGGAMGRVPADATAFAHRNRRLMVNVAALFTNPEDYDKHDAWVAKLAAFLQKDEKGAYVNFLGNEGAERVREAYPAGTWERLTKVKAQYDPKNLFRMNQNIPPAK